MYEYLQNFNSIMELAELLSGEQFTRFLQDVVFPYQTAERDTTGFEQLPLKPAYNMTYAALQQENNIHVMANHVAIDAHAKPTPTRGVSALEGTIPGTATNLTMNKEDYLKVAKLLHDAEMMGSSVKVAAQDMLQSKFSDKLADHACRASFMRDYVVFNGKYDITKDNNDGSFTDVTFDFGVPEKNKKKLTTNARWWTTEDHKTEGSESNPVVDIDHILIDLERVGIRRQNVVIEIGILTMNDLLNHSAVRADLALYLNPSLAGNTPSERAQTTAAMSIPSLKDALERRLGGVTFLVRDFMTSLPSINKKTGSYDMKNMTGFKEETLVFRPKGKIGEIHSSGHLTVGGGAGSNGIYGLYDGGRILMSYTCDVREMVQIWDTAETSLFVLTAGLNMRYLTVR